MTNSRPSPPSAKAFGTAADFYACNNLYRVMPLLAEPQEFSPERFCFAVLIRDPDGHQTLHPALESDYLTAALGEGARHLLDLADLCLIIVRTSMAGAHNEPLSMTDRKAITLGDPREVLADTPAAAADTILRHTAMLSRQAGLLARA